LVGVLHRLLEDGATVIVIDHDLIAADPHRVTGPWLAFHLARDQMG
jgi:hypothetical protein